MEDILKYIFIISEFIGIALCIIGLRGFKRLEKEHKKISDSDYLLEHEKPVQNRNIGFFAIGLIINVTATLFLGIISII